MSTQPLWDAEERHYIASVTQTGTAAPVAEIISNTLTGIPVWARSSTGIYTLTLQAEFRSGKTSGSAINADQTPIGATRTDENTITVQVGDDGVLNASINVTVWK